MARLPSSEATNPQGELGDRIEVLQEGAPLFAMVPHCLAQDSSLGDKAFRLWIVLQSHAGFTSREAWPSIALLAEELNCGERTVFRAQNELVKRGLLKIQSGQAAGVHNVYTVVYPQPGGGDMGVRGGTTPVSGGVRHQCHTEQEPLNKNQGTRNPPTPLRPLERADATVDHAEKLVALAYQQRVKPPNRRKALAATVNALHAGYSYGELDRAIRAGPIVWTEAGLQTAVAKTSPKPVQHRDGIDMSYEEIHAEYTRLGGR